MQNKNTTHKKTFHDIVVGKTTGHVIDLKDRTWRNRLVFGSISLVAIMILVTTLLYGPASRASIASLYPTTCLGDVLQSDLATDEPETLYEAGFDETNSSVFVDQGQSIFCTDFVGDLPEQVIINSASLKLYWTVVKERQLLTDPLQEGVVEQVVELATGGGGSAAHTSLEDDGLDLNLDTEHGTSTTSTTPVSEDGVGEKQVLGVEEEIVEQDDAEPDLATEEVTEGFQDIPLLVEELNEPETVKEADLVSDEAEESVADELVGEGTAVPELIVPDGIVPDEAQEPVVVPAEEETETNQALWRSWVVPTALAQTNTGDEEQVADASQEIPDGAIAEILYSFDGVLWHHLEWLTHDTTVTRLGLPLASLNQLTSLQISLRSLQGIESDTIILLDGMSVDVGYMNNDSEGEQYERVGAADEEGAAPDELYRIISQKTFDDRSQHSCTIEPFVQQIQHGDTAFSTIQLVPSRLEGATRLVSGELPPFVTAEIFDEVYETAEQGTAKLLLSTSKATPRGSYNVIIVYEEQQYDGLFLPNFCQLNLIVE